MPMVSLDCSGRRSFAPLLRSSPPACGRRLRRRRPLAMADLTNPFLGPRLVGWLVGPIAASPPRRRSRQYLALKDDAAGGRLHREFWQKRDPAPTSPAIRSARPSTERAPHADRLYSEARLPRPPHRPRRRLRALWPRRRRSTSRSRRSPTGRRRGLDLRHRRALRARRQAAVPVLPLHQERRPDRALRPGRASAAPPCRRCGASAVAPTRRLLLMTQARAVLAGTGIAIPPLEVDNHMLSRIIETSDDWVRERSGIVDPLLRRAGRRLLRPRSRGGAGGPGGRRHRAPARSTTWSAPP